MSQENVEMVRRGFEAWNAGDMRAYAELFDSDAVVRPPARWPEPGPFVGRDAVRFLEQLRDAWDTDNVEPIGDFLDAGDRVVMRLAWSGQGQGPAAVMEISVVLTIRNGKVLSFESFWDHAEALEAIGLQG
jgi:uncharacterized protein